MSESIRYSNLTLVSEALQEPLFDTARPSDSGSFDAYTINSTLCFPIDTVRELAELCGATDFANKYAQICSDMRAIKERIR